MLTNNALLCPLHFWDHFDCWLGHNHKKPLSRNATVFHNHSWRTEIVWKQCSIGREGKCQATWHNCLTFWLSLLVGLRAAENHATGDHCFSTILFLVVSNHCLPVRWFSLKFNFLICPSWHQPCWCQDCDRMTTKQHCQFKLHKGHFELQSTCWFHILPCSTHFSFDWQTTSNNNRTDTVFGSAFNFSFQTHCVCFFGQHERESDPPSPLCFLHELH